MGSWRLVDYN